MKPKVKDITVKAAAMTFRGAELGGGGGVTVVSDGGLGIDAVAGGGGGLVVPAGGVADGVGDGEVAGDCGGGEVEAEGAGDGAIEGEGEGEVVGGDAGGGLEEVEDTETDSFCPPRQCWPKVQMKWCSPAAESVKLAGERPSGAFGVAPPLMVRKTTAEVATTAFGGQSWVVEEEDESGWKIGGRSDGGDEMVTVKRK
ncbi:hypothetical protein Acr_29g0000210 [Actinidia rufa]|uniref:Uncharacterized protein n=1 Tax=Actinidia rufa TaxID=165716 RepID=A0A7J0HCR9_9ERIC|nr:hypothetical protein Acr_29g0000210 [Actinidia rufa]